MYLSIDFERHDALSIRVEGSHGRCFIGDGALERRRRFRREPHREVPEWRDEQPLEQHSAANRRGEQRRSAQRRSKELTGDAEPECKAEKETWRGDRPERLARHGLQEARSGVSAVGNRVSLAFSVEMTGVCVCVAAVTDCISTVRAVPVGMRTRGTSAPEAAQRHASKADGAQQETRDVEVHQRDDR